MTREMIRKTSPFHTFIVLGACTLLLAGCVSREQADAKLGKACAAGVSALLPEGRKIERIAETKISTAPEGQDMRLVQLKAIENDGFLEIETPFECTFEEGFGPLNLSYNAVVYQLRMGETVIGRSGDEILGNTTDFVKLTEAVTEAMR